MNAPTTPLKGKRVFLYFLAFFGMIAVVNGVMIILALRTHTGTVTEHAYEKGLAYNDVVNAKTDQEKLGWKGNIALNNNRLTFALFDASNEPIQPDSVKVQFSRPTQAGMDFEVELKNGEASILFPTKGSWEVRVFATVGDKKYQQVKRVVVE